MRGWMWRVGWGGVGESGKDIGLCDGLYIW